MRDWFETAGAVRFRSGRWFLALVVTALAAIRGVAVQAQERGDLIRVKPLRPVPQAFNADAAPLLIDTSAPVVNLLQRAEDGVARGDWKLAIDSLQRVIDDPEGALVARADGASEDGMLYESARRKATRRIASFPPEGLRAYRLLYDGQAKRLFDRARSEGPESSKGPAGLRLIASRYLLTDYGDDASELLASWALDEGRPGEALALLTDVLELVADRDMPDLLLVGKQAAAYLMLGQYDQAATIIADYRRKADPAQPAPGWLASLTSRPASYGWSAAMSDEASPSPYRPAPPIAPSLLESAPWVYELPGTTADLWRRIFDDDPMAPLVLPSSQFVSDGTRLVVRKAAGCAALDVQDLVVLWESSGRRRSGSRGNARDRAVERNVTPSQPPAERVEDYIGGAISVAGGLVFTVERGVAGAGTDAQNAPGVLPPNPGVGVHANATRVVAYDARSGEVRWQRGASSPESAKGPADELADVQFRAAPIGVGDQLWVPYFKQSDLFVAVLNSADGALIHSTLLGSAREPISAVGPTLLPASADGMVFVPSGYGALFALDAADATVRWACQYERGSRPRRDPRIAPVTGWLPSPPVVAGGLVLLAATDHRELSAFSAGSGEFRWSASVENGSYVIAADATRVWLGGRNISCLSVADGKPRWTTHLIAVPTGRGVVCGELLFAPTSEGLLSLDAATGASIGVQSTPPSQAPLGDLLCLGTALFSVDPSSVRKFPDLERSHSAALARRQALPADPSAAMQLAWVELLRGEPTRADEVLRQIPTATLANDAHQRESFARVSVETAIALAGKSPSGSPEALKWLQVADAAALTAADRLRCRAAVADQHVAGGRYEEAYRTLLQLGLSPEADQMVRTAESVESAAGIQIADRLRNLQTKLSSEQIARLDAEIGRQLAEAGRRLQDGREVRKARAQLQAIADLPAIGSAGKCALVELADWERQQLRFERAEQLLLEGVRRASDVTGLMAFWGLCGLYVRSAQDQMAALIPCLDELEKRFGSEPVPETVARLPEATSPSAPGSRQVVADWAAEVRHAIPSAVREAYPSTLSGRASDLADRIDLTAEAAWSYQAAEGSSVGRVVRVAPDRSPLLKDRILLYRSDGQLDCLSSDRGELLWQTRLRLPEEFTETAFLPNPPAEAARGATADGQIVVFDGAEGLFAVGLATGRRLWARARDTVLETAEAGRRDGAMAAADGLLAATPREGRLTLMRMIDGSTVWERDLRGEPVGAIWMNARRVVTVDAGRQRVHLFDRADGRLVERVLFRQTDPTQQVVSLVRTAGMIIGPDSTGASKGVIAVDDATGEPAWKVELDRPAVQLFEPQEGYLGIGLGQGMVRIIDAANGETVLERQVAGAYSVSGGALFDGLLVLRVDAARGQRQAPQLVALDVATGEEVWRREDVASLPNTDDLLRVDHGVIPALVETMQPEVSPAGVAMPRTRSALVLIDVRTGRNAGMGADLTAATTGSRFTGDIVIRPGAVIVGTTRGVSAFRTKPVERNEAGRNF